MSDGDLVERARAWALDVHPHGEHLQRTLDYAVELDPEASAALRIAAVTHDIERAWPDDSAGWVPSRDWNSVDYNRWHQDRCADMVARWLREQRAPDELVADVRALVSVHEDGGWPEADVLQAADSLSFLDTMVPLVVGWIDKGLADERHAAAKLHHSVVRMSPALTRARELAEPMLERGLDAVRAAAAAKRAA
jgi:hypothetical protein